MNGLLDSSTLLGADADLVRGIALIVFSLVTFAALTRIGRVDDEERAFRSAARARRMPALVPSRSPVVPTPAAAASEAPAPVIGSAAAGSLVGTR